MPKFINARIARLLMGAAFCVGIGHLCIADAEVAKKVPPKVERALRARAEEFLQDHATGAFSKAYDLVAEDSRDRFLSLPKEPLSDPRITNIEYRDNFTKAVVSTSIVRKASMGAAGVREIPGVRNDSWKSERGKWVWFFDPTRECVTTLFGTLPCSGEDIKARKGESSPSVPEKITPEALAARMKELNRGSGFDKPGFRLVRGVAGSNEIVYHNGLPGQIQISLDFTSNAHEGYKLEPEAPVVVDGYKDLRMRVTYSGSAPDSAQPLGVRMFIDPFSTFFTIPIQFASPEEATAEPPAKP